MEEPIYHGFGKKVNRKISEGGRRKGKETCVNLQNSVNWLTKKSVYNVVCTATMTPYSTSVVPVFWRATSLQCNSFNEYVKNRATFFTLTLVSRNTQQPYYTNFSCYLAKQSSNAIKIG